MKLKNLIIASLFAFAVIGCEDKDSKEEQAEEQLEKQTETQAELTTNYDAPFMLALSDGNFLSMKKNTEGFEIANNDKATLFVFFTTWCPPCKAQMPYLVQSQKKFEKDIKIVGVLMEEGGVDMAKKFYDEMKLNFPIAYDENNFFFAKAVGDMDGLPYMLLLDKKGSEIRDYCGMLPIEMLEIELKKAFL